MDTAGSEGDEQQTTTGEELARGFQLNALELVALLRAGADGAPRVLAVDRPEPSLSPRVDALDVAQLDRSDRERLLRGEGAQAASSGNVDYAIVAGSTLAAAADTCGMLAALRPVCRSGIVVAPPVRELPGECGSNDEWQMLELDWDAGPSHLLLLRRDRPPDGTDGSLDRVDDERAARMLAEAQVKTLFGDLKLTFGRGVREWTRRNALERQVEKLRGWSLGRRLYTGAIFNHRYRKVHRRAQAAADPPEPLFFVIGAAKSGTTWLMRALDEHPEVLCMGEGRFFGKPVPGRIEGRSLLESMLSSPELANWVQECVWTRTGSFQDVMERLAGAGVERLLRERAAIEGKRIVGDKTPLYGEAQIVAQISRACPDARVVHLVRDGRDVATSALHHLWRRADRVGGRLPEEAASKRERYRAGWRPSDESLFPGGHLETAAREWSAVTGRALRQGRELFGERHIVVRYEDMLGETAPELGRVLRFLGASTDAAVIRRCVERASFQRMAGRAGRSWRRRERGVEDPTSFFRKGVAGEWRQVYTESDRETFLELAGPLLAELGYEVD